MHAKNKTAPGTINPHHSKLTPREKQTNKKQVFVIFSYDCTVVVPVPSRRHSRIKHSIVCFCFPLLYLSSAKAELIRGSGLWPTHLQSTHHITVAEQHCRLTSGECLCCGWARATLSLFAPLSQKVAPASKGGLRSFFVKKLLHKVGGRLRAAV